MEQRKPPVPMESKVVKSLRVEPSMWLRVEKLAPGRHEDISETARVALLHGLTLLENPAAMEAYTRVLAQTARHTDVYAREKAS